jgi:hypothetical protein
MSLFDAALQAQFMRTLDAGGRRPLVLAKKSHIGRTRTATDESAPNGSKALNTKGLDGGLNPRF